MAKEILFNIDARDQLKKGVDALAQGYRGSGGCCQKSVRYGEEWRPRTGVFY